MTNNKPHRNLRIVRYIFYKETLVDFKEHLWSFIGSFVGIGLIGYIQNSYLPTADNIFLIGSFGASSVLVYGAIQSPLAQPRNLVGGHLVSAVIGVTIHTILPHHLLIAAPLAVSLSIVLMQITKTLHPPGGATALIAVIGTESITSLGYWYVLYPVFSGTMILLVVGLVVNNMTSRRRYPTDTKYTRLLKTNLPLSKLINLKERQ
ncbi:HPP family protein [Reichenbachiella sp. 5M10]|uniref:HPP family protein n=1 Tax=Reichenbachiella sp. 5M10 TaxID=1889772 RepID=UPI000C147B24|nr:HPP family protein [Reichenbachiella sp. 5M10]PIB35973.1 HPP family protein [Reichenbachiella sp. 5M10]